MALPVSDCIARVDADAINIAWCGKRGATPFFLDLDQVAFHGTTMKNPHAACPACLAAAIAALRKTERKPTC